jgi:hypothetical protein
MFMQHRSLRFVSAVFDLRLLSHKDLSMKTLVSRATSALSLATLLCLSGCGVELLMLAPTLLSGAQLASALSSGGVQVKFDEKAIEAAKNEKFGAGATKVAIWPTPASKIPVRQTEILGSYKSSVKVISPNELTKSLRLYQVNEAIDSKTEADLVSDFTTLCSKGVADVFVASTFDTAMRKNKQSAISSMISFGILANKNNGYVKTTMYDCRAQKVVTLSGDTEVESGMNSPERSEIETHVGEVIAKVVGSILGITPAELPADKAK